MKIYVASSWRNPYQPRVVAELRALDHEVYDFRNPEPGDNGFAWRSIEPGWERWSPSQWRRALEHPLAVRGFKNDYTGMEWADACVLVLPSGRSSHLEAGYMAGQGKPVVMLALEDHPDRIEPDLMVGLFGSDSFAVTWGEMHELVARAGLEVRLRQEQGVR